MADGTPTYNQVMVAHYVRVLNDEHIMRIFFYFRCWYLLRGRAG